MIRPLILATSMLALAAMSSEALAYSNVSPTPGPHKTTSVQDYLQSSPAFDQTMPSSTIEPDSYRYHGGPKPND